MATINVSNQTQFLAALKAAKGGDTILLANGHYGDLDLKHDFASNVTIKAANPLGAEFTRMGLVGATNITLDGIQFETGLAVKEGSKNIAVLNSDIDGHFYTRNVNGLKIDNVDVSGGNFGLLLNSVQNFSVTNSYIHEVSEDLMRITGNSYNGLIENNIISDTLAKKPLHPDIIQFFQAKGIAPHDITIRGNLLYDAPDEGKVPAQGIFVSDPGRGAANHGYHNILIEENLINTASTNTIFINSGDSTVEILNNTLMSRGGGGGTIRLVGKVFEDGGPVIDGNVFRSLINETGSATLGDNYIYGKGADLSKLFSSILGDSWASYIPVDGSPIDFGSGYGAAARLLQLIKGTQGVWEDNTSDQSELPGGDAQNSDPGGVTSPPTTATDAKVTYEGTETYEISGPRNWAKILHEESMALEDGAIAFTFNADSLHTKQGLIAKGAKGNDDDISVFLVKDKLIVRFENEKGDISISHTGLKANTDYDVLITFENNTLKVWLDSTLIGEANFDFDLSDNDEDLVIGAMNGLSDRGATNKAGMFFDGTISEVTFYDQALSPAAAAALDDAAHVRDVEEISAFHFVQNDAFS